jgi:hypothetical protein
MEGNISVEHFHTYYLIKYSEKSYFVSPSLFIKQETDTLIKWIFSMCEC